MRGVVSPRTSVIIRNFNRSRCVSRAIDSALLQSDSDLEIVVVDDASTDDSVELIRSRYAASPGVRLIEVDANVGAGEAANIGLEAANGEYLAFLDSDDEWLPNFLEAHIAALQSRPTAAISFCDYVEVWEPYGFERILYGQLPSNQRHGMLIGGFVHTMSLTVLKREALEFVPSLDARYRISHDYFLWLNLTLELHQPFVRVAQPLVRHYRSHDGVTTQHQSWLAEYRDAVTRGFRHPLAKFYEDELPKALESITLGIYAREQTGKWLASTSGASMSVIVRASRSVSALQRALKSVQRQTLTSCDVTVVYDPGHKDLGDWLEAQEEYDLQIIPCGPVFGPGAALNLGMAAAQGSLLAFLDDDAEWADDYLATQLRANSYAVGNPSFSVTDIELVDTQDNAVTYRGLGPVPVHDDLLLHILQSPPRVISNLVCRRDRALEAGMHDGLAFGTALDLMLRLIGKAQTADTRPTYVSRPPARVPRPLVRVFAQDSAVGGSPEDVAANLAVIVEYHTRNGAQQLRLLRRQILDQLTSAAANTHFA
jgi:glycosyltransferase involved in cell wall biosynthesis